MRVQTTLERPGTYRKKGAALFLSLVSFFSEKWWICLYRRRLPLVPFFYAHTLERALGRIREAFALVR